jgi:hypothetical protein
VLNRSRLYVITAAVAIAAAACGSESIAGPTGNPLTGLKETTTHDSNTSNPGGSGPGYFHGTVLGQSAPGGGTDTLATAPRIANVKVTIYQGVQTASGVTTGTEQGSVVTDASGQFTLPTLPGGLYVVTFVPPTGSPYHGVYAFGTLSSVSGTYPWWVVLGTA